MRLINFFLYFINIFTFFLIDLIKNHGVVARPYTKNKVSRTEGAGSIVEMLEEWDNDAAILEEVDLEALDDVIKALDNMRDSDTDPRNIRFTYEVRIFTMDM